MGHIGKAPVGWDGRSPTLEAQAKSSIATGSMSMNATPTPVKVEVIEERIRANAAYVTKFKAALGDAPINIDTIAQAIAAFDGRSSPPSRRSIVGSRATKPRSRTPPSAASRSTTTRRCASPATAAGASPTTCSTTSAPPPPIAAAAPWSRTIRPCSSRSRRRPCATSTLRPPYMHHGLQVTLDEVMRHYEKGGIDRPSRSPLMQPIQLTDQERQDLVAFMETLTRSGRSSAVVPKSSGAPSQLPAVVTCDARRRSCSSPCTSFSTPANTAVPDLLRSIRADSCHQLPAVVAGDGHIDHRAGLPATCTGVNCSVRPTLSNSISTRRRLPTSPSR